MSISDTHGASKGAIAADWDSQWGTESWQGRERRDGMLHKNIEAGLLQPRKAALNAQSRGAAEGEDEGPSGAGELRQRRRSSRADEGVERKGEEVLLADDQQQCLPSVSAEEQALTVQKILQEEAEERRRAEVAESVEMTEVPELKDSGGSGGDAGRDLEVGFADGEIGGGQVKEVVKEGSVGTDIVLLDDEVEAKDDAKLVKKEDEESGQVRPMAERAPSGMTSGGGGIEMINIGEFPGALRMLVGPPRGVGGGFQLASLGGDMFVDRESSKPPILALAHAIAKANGAYLQSHMPDGLVRAC